MKSYKLSDKRTESMVGGGRTMIGIQMVPRGSLCPSIFLRGKKWKSLVYLRHTGALLLRADGSSPSPERTCRVHVESFIFTSPRLVNNF